MYHVFQCLAGDARDICRPVVRRRVSRPFLENWNDPGMPPICWNSSLV